MGTLNIIFLVSLGTAFAEVLVTRPQAESLYNLEIVLRGSCEQADFSQFCSELDSLSYKQCEVKGCGSVIVSFDGWRDSASISDTVTNIKTLGGVSVSSIQPRDVDECTSSSNLCSQHANCYNQIGQYSCRCGFGYSESVTSAVNGTNCVISCNPQSCSGLAECQESTEDGLNVNCICPAGYQGAYCNVIIKSLLPEWAVIFISVATVLAALTGLGLCAYSGYQLFCVKRVDEETESRSIGDYKPKSLPYDYTQFSDVGSFSRGSAINRGYLDEDRPDPELVNDGLQFGARKLEATLATTSSELSEYGDPTPALNPISITDRHSLTEIASQPDYY